MKRVLLCFATLALLAACQNLPYEGAAMQSGKPAAPWGVTTIDGIPVAAP
jgi:hypothetical protein